MQDAVRSLVEIVELEVRTCGSISEFLDVYEPTRPGCVVLDVRMPITSGIEALQEFEKRSIHAPVIVITGFGDVRTAVRAMKAGAIEFFEKPFNNEELLECVQECVRRDVENLKRRAEVETVTSRLATLTTREQEVLALLVAGHRNKEISEKLGIGIRTVETHRAQIMKKMKASNVVDITNMLELRRIGDVVP